VTVSGESLDQTHSCKVALALSGKMGCDLSQVEEARRTDWKAG
jgi:hypothetical protein